MDRLPLLAILALAATGLAGCGDAPDAAPGHDVEIRSSLPTEITSGERAAADGAPRGGLGHLAGVVVDQAIRPIEGARVRLPTLDLEEATARDGSFAFVDLVPSVYLVHVEAAGFRPAEATVSVEDGDFTRAKVVLTAIPPPAPYHTVQALEGYAEATASPHAATNSGCEACTFDFQIDPDGLVAVIVEAAYETPAGANQRGFVACWGCDTYLCVGCGAEPAPMRLELRGDDLANRTVFRLEVIPTTSPAPETGVRFDVYATAFYHQLPPAGWSFLAGDP
jgi:hypothetical protein